MRHSLKMSLVWTSEGRQPISVPFLAALFLSSSLLHCFPWDCLREWLMVCASPAPFSRHGAQFLFNSL